MNMKAHDNSVSTLIDLRGETNYCIFHYYLYYIHISMFHAEQC